MIGIVIVLIVLIVIIAVLIILGVLEFSEMGGGGTQNKGGMIFKRGGGWGVLTPLLMW